MGLDGLRDAPRSGRPLKHEFATVMPANLLPASILWRSLHSHPPGSCYTNLLESELVN